MKHTVIIALLFLANVVRAQSPEEVVELYIQAIGGRANLEKVKTIRADIEVESNGFVMDGQLAFSFPDKEYTEMNVRGEKLITVINGNKGWMVNPMTGSSAPFPMSEEQIRASKKNMAADQLLDASSYTIEDLGERKVKGQNYRVLKVKFNKGYQAQQNRYFNTATRLIDYVEIESLSGSNGFMAFKDYVAINGIKFPGMILNYTRSDLDSPSMTLKLKNLKVNTAVDMKLFEKPQK